LLIGQAAEGFIVVPKISRWQEALLGGLC